MQARPRGALLPFASRTDLPRERWAQYRERQCDVNVEPRPCPSLSARTCPPCSSTSYEREAQTEAPMRTRGRAVPLSERLEHVRKHIRSDTFPGILDHDIHHAAGATH